MAKKFQKLSRANIRALDPGEKISEHGIIAERIATGDIRYSINIMVDGQRIHRSLGLERDGTTRTQAEDFIAKVRSDAKEHRLNLPKGRKTHLEFSEAADKYIKRLGQTDGKNLVAKERQFRLYLKPHFKSQRLDRLTEFAIERYKKERVKSGASTGTVNRELATLSHLLNKAEKWKWVRVRPCTFTLFPENEGRIIALSDEDCEALRNAALQDIDPDIWLFIEFALNTAMRHSEMLQSRFDQVNFERLRLFVPKAKAGQREQPITPELRDILLNEQAMRNDPEGWIFESPRPGASSTGHRHRMNAPFKRVVENAGLDPETITPHVMRHTAITKLVQAGIDLPTIQKISGHKTIDMVLRYTHIHGKHIDNAISVLGKPEQKVVSITPKLHKQVKKK